MGIRITDLNCKEVICISDGRRLGFVSDVEIITLDANGRFLIPKRYLKLAQITQDVRIIGMDNTIEIWSKENADKPFMEPESFGRELEAIMSTPKE